MDSITILIVDDHPIVLKGIHALLSSSFPRAGILDAAGVGEAEEILVRHDVDIMITDLDLNGESGTTLIRHVRDIRPATQVVVYTMHEEPWSVSEIDSMDVEAVVMKSDSAGELLTAVGCLLDGRDITVRHSPDCSVRRSASPTACHVARRRWWTSRRRAFRQQT